MSEVNLKTVNEVSGEEEGDAFDRYRDLLTRSRNGYEPTKDEREFMREFFRVSRVTPSSALLTTTEPTP